MNGLLFIDDEEGVRRSMARALKREPYKTYTAKTGQEEIVFIKEHLSLIEIVILVLRNHDRSTLSSAISHQYHKIGQIADTLRSSPCGENL